MIVVLLSKAHLTSHSRMSVSRSKQRNRRKKRNGMTRDLFKNIRDTKGTFHAKTGSIKDRNGRDLTEAEDIKKRWQEHTEDLYKNRSS